MKKILFSLLAFVIVMSASAQQANKFRIDTKEMKRSNAPTIGIEPIKSIAITKSDTKSEVIAPTERDINIVTIKDIGTSANGYSYGYAGGQKSILWVEPDLNMVTNFHRMGGTLDPDGYSGDLGYDISTDGGATWTNMVECYVATDNGGGDYYYDAARYPNHGIYNPTNNIEDAVVQYFVPILDNSNSSESWGGYAYGIADISDPATTTKTTLSTHDDYYQYIPDGYELTANGDAWAIDINQDWSTESLDYQNSLIINHGVWSGTDFDLTQSLIDFEIIDVDNQGKPAFVQVAFSEDGMTGYIAVIANNGSAEVIGGASNLYPIYWKTTDGGQNWDGPNYIQLDGPNGLGGIVYHHLTDQLIADLFEPPVPSREEISYTTAFDMNIAVDNNGNMHMAVMIGPTGSDAYSIVTANGYLAAVDIFTTDGGTSWFAEEMGRVATFRGTFGTDFTEDNRIQITTSPDRSMIFVSWLDTDIEDAEDNDRPNIWARGFVPASYMKTANGSGEDAPTNVTLFSEGMWSSYFFVAPKLCLQNGDTYTIPFTYQDGDPTDPAVEVQYKYVSDFSYSTTDFTIQGIDNPSDIKNSVTVSQNFPNPFKTESYVTLTLDEGTNVNMEVYSLTGQKVSEKSYGYLTNGSHTLTIKGNDLTSGVYFYTITVGENKYTHKMIIE